MPYYPSADALLAELRLRRSGLGAARGILVLEGADDKRLFRLNGVPSAQLVPAGGRTLLLSALSKSTDEDLDTFLYLTDCDYEVALGNMRPTPGLIITHNVDVESDLIELNGFEQIVIELVPAALESEAKSQEIASSLLKRSTELASMVGRIRFAARPRGIDLRLDERDLKYRKMRDGSPAAPVLERVVRSVTSSVLGGSGLSPVEFLRLVELAPSGYRMCNGKDLLRAAAFVLREDFHVKGVTAEDLARLLRANASLDHWEVLRRMRHWQEKTSRQILP